MGAVRTGDDGAWTTTRRGKEQWSGSGNVMNVDRQDPLTNERKARKVRQEVCKAFWLSGWTGRGASTWDGDSCRRGLQGKGGSACGACAECEGQEAARDMPLRSRKGLGWRY